MRRMLALCSLWPTLLSAQRQQSGSITFVSPASWTSERSGQVLNFTPAGLRSAESVLIGVMPGQALTGTFDDWFAQRISRLTNGKTVLTRGPLSPGMRVLRP